MSSLALILIFIAGAAVSLTWSWVLVSGAGGRTARTILASGIALHRRVIAMEGGIAVGLCVACLVAIVGTVPGR